METLTLLFLGCVLGLYILMYFLKDDKKMGEFRLLTLVMGVCSICTIITDESLNGTEIGLLPIFPVVFIMFHTVVGLIWQK